MRYNNVIIRPIVTEKSTSNQENNRYAFEVTLKATKGKIADMISKMFSVDVISVATSITPGKPKRILRTRLVTKTPKKKKAYITLKKGQSIDLVPAN